LKTNTTILLKVKFIIVFVFVCNAVLAQLETDNWIYKPLYRLSFNGGTNPSEYTYSVPNFAVFMNGSIAMSNAEGTLQFWGSTGVIFDKNFQAFPSLHTNGVLNRLNWSATATATQTMLVIPITGQDSTYYIFHIGGTDVEAPTESRLFYSKIDMRLRGGLGEIVSSVRNVPLLGGAKVQFKLTAALHCNKKDIWVLGHLVNSDKYFSILVKADGLVMPTNYFSGSFIASTGIYSGIDPVNSGACKVSPNGNKFVGAMALSKFVELFDFNTVTGLGTNYQKITNIVPNTALPNLGNGPRGVAFSPSGQRLYVTAQYEEADDDGDVRTVFVYQFNTTLAGDVAINNSATLLYKTPDYEAKDACEMQLANNGKLYTGTERLDEIPFPENLGLSCGYNAGVVPFTGATPVISFPNYLESYFRYPIIATGNCQFQNISFSIQNPVGVSSVVWDFGDPASGVNNSSTSFNPTHIFSTQGSYLVKAVLQNANGCGADTIRKLVYAGQYKVYLGNDTSFCKNDTLTLKMKIPLATNTWSNGSTDTLIKITQPGTYWVKVKLGECIASDTIVVTQNPLPQFTLGADTVICNNASITLAPNPNYINSTYTWSNATTNATNTVNNAGLHWLQLTDSKGCKYRDSITISFKTLPNYSLGNDTAICQKDTITLNATVAGATNYTWNTTATTPIIKAFTTNTYWCDVNKEGCIYRDSINLLVKPLPLVNLGKDTTICEDKTYLLNATNTNASYLWQDASTNPTYLVSQAGMYHVKVTMSNCINRDTTIVQYQLKPKFTLGADKLICPSLTYTLNPQLNPNGISFLWQDGTTDTTLKISQAGLYYLDVTNYCGTTRDSIQVTKGLCKVYVPTAFTPNNDGVNDVFKIGGGEAIKDFTLTVYNRWGAKVYTTTNTQNGWNGTVNNKPQPTGAYIYNISYKDAVTNEVFKMKGTVVLIR
jgi:gliding motility-associated-like protein